MPKPPAPADKAQEELNHAFNGFLDKTSDLVYFKSREGRIQFCTQSMADLFGYANWRDMVGRLDSELFPESTSSIYEKEEAYVFASGKPLLNELNRYTTQSGEPGYVQTSRWPLFNAQGEVESIFGIGRDVTQARQAQDNLQLAANVFTHAREGIVIADAQGLIVDVNAAFCRITGYSLDEVRGRNPSVLSSGLQSAAFYKSMWRAIQTEGYWSGEIWNRHKNGQVFAEILTISAVRGDDQQIKNYVALFTDITQIKEHQKQLEHIAHYDQLTDLPNRLLFADRLSQAMHACERRKRSLSVIYLDLDGFKAVNDTFGHDAGDTLLVTLSQRMKSALREGDSLARFGGDEFVAVLVDLEHPQDCLPVLERLLQAACTPVQMEYKGAPVELSVSASIGATSYPQDAADADQLMRHADQAMYMAKQAGKNRYHLFDVEQDSAMKSAHRNVEEIGEALARREFVLHYQPKVDMHTGQVVGAEALIRWHHPERGLLLPAHFLPHIEDHAFSVELGEWVINTALEQMSQWRNDGLDVSISVNVGAQQLQQDDFVDKLMSILRQHPQVPHDRLELEILESSALADITVVAKLLTACRERDVRFALDDFGTGYSSLTYLKHLPAQTLKIDQSFVRDMVSDPEDMAIVNGVIGLAKAFGRHVIAEGVETAEQRDMLLQLGCRLMQGYGIARPMPAHALPDWIRAWHTRPQMQR